MSYDKSPHEANSYLIEINVSRQEGEHTMSIIYLFGTHM